MEAKREGKVSHRLSEIQEQPQRDEGAKKREENWTHIPLGGIGPGSVALPIGIGGLCPPPIAPPPPAIPIPIPLAAPTALCIFVLTCLVFALFGSRWNKKASNGLLSIGLSQS